LIRIVILALSVTVFCKLFLNQEAVEYAPKQAQEHFVEPMPQLVKDLPSKVVSKTPKS